MTSRERLLAVFNKQEVDRVPWSPLMDWYFLSSLQAKGYGFTDAIEGMKLANCDLMERHVNATYRTTTNVETKTVREGNKSIYRMETPLGYIEEIKEQNGQTWFITKHLLEDKRDLEIYQYIIEHTQVHENYKAFLEKDAHMGDYGIAVPDGPLTPIQSLFQFAMGIENGVYMIADYEDEVRSLFEAMHELNLKEYKLLAEGPSPVVFAYEDTSTTVLSKWYYQDFCAGYIDQYADTLHQGGKKYITHMCGKLTGFIQEVGAGRMDGIDSLCPPTTGDLWACDARKAWGESKIIIGGIEPPALSRMTAEESVEYVAKVIESMRPCRSFILSTGDAVSYGTPLENLQAISRYVQELGDAPLH